MSFNSLWINYIKYLCYWCFLVVQWECCCLTAAGSLVRSWSQVPVRVEFQSTSSCPAGFPPGSLECVIGYVCRVPCIGLGSHPMYIPASPTVLPGKSQDQLWCLPPLWGTDPSHIPKKKHSNGDPLWCVFPPRAQYSQIHHHHHQDETVTQNVTSTVVEEPETLFDEDQWTSDQSPVSTGVNSKFLLGISPPHILSI